MIAVMAIQKNPAIVIKTLPFRTSSLIVTSFTRDFGKVRGLAKGVRLERETRGALYELFSHLEIVYYEKTRSDLHLISEAFLLDSYDALRIRFDSIAYASYFAELVDELTEIQDPHPKIFDLLDFSFQYLASLPGQRLARLFEIKLLNEIGWLPYLEGCLTCRKPVPEKGYFSARQGALLCENCAASHPDALRIEENRLPSCGITSKTTSNMPSK
jgi:DNA repair protein RecO (recombination protein O)